MEQGRIRDLSTTLIHTGIHMGNPEQVSPYKGYRQPRDILILGHSKNIWGQYLGPCEILVAKRENSTCYSRVRFLYVRNVWGFGTDGKGHGISRPSNDDYRSKVAYLWGGKENVREVTLV
ncbi:hypothetical protein GGR51DRAFT_518012 [Nemania sp. FL0031]|nr:hypothetical protein GGR51DRAFT_518012 [Nemania sp. FL0031]